MFQKNQVCRGVPQLVRSDQESVGFRETELLLGKRTTDPGSVGLDKIEHIARCAISVPYAPSHYAPIRAFLILFTSASVRAKVVASC